VRFLHTSDWHLGRSFFGASLLEDQAHVLDRLVTLAAESQLDAVLIAGDVYDRSVPPADAVALLDDTLVRLVVECGIPVVLIAGNHDSGDRLGFASRLLTGRGLHVAGTAPLVVRFTDAHGVVDVVALPFAEPAATAARCEDDSISDHDAAIRADLARCLGTGDAPASNRQAPVRNGQAPARTGASAPRRIAVSHAFVSGGTTSESERPLVLGNAALVAAEAFDGFAYVALGHLHRPQRVGRDEVRYSGSLLKYSFDEATHRKSVSIVDLRADGSASIEEVELGVRRDVRVLEGSIDEILAKASADGARDDYVLARLSDRGAVIDAMGKLRMAYANCLHIQRNEFLAAHGEGGERVDLRKQSQEEMFDAFFREMTGEEPDADERRAFAEAIAQARRQED
jgi:exonuclease SbcD